LFSQSAKSSIWGSSESSDWVILFDDHRQLCFMPTLNCCDMVSAAIQWAGSLGVFPARHPGFTEAT